MPALREDDKNKGQAMSDNIHILQVTTTLDIPAERVLDAAKEAGLKHVLLLGEYEDGTEYFASTRSGGPEALWALERAKFKLLQIVDQP